VKVVTGRGFRDRASEMFRSDDVVLVTRDGKPAGFYIPWDQPDLPIELKRELFVQLGEVVHAEREAAGVTEDEILADFAEWRAARDRRPWRQHPPLGRHRRSRPGCTAQSSILRHAPLQLVATAGFLRWSACGRLNPCRSQSRGQRRGLPNFPATKVPREL